VKLPRTLSRALGIDQLRAERDAYLIERNEFLRQLDIALGERNEFLRQLDLTKTERDDLQRELDEVRSQRDDLLASDEKRDRLPAALQSAQAERQAYLDQRDQAYREIEDLIRACNELRAEVSRLRGQFPSGYRQCAPNAADQTPDQYGPAEPPKR
jgi:chromosome segregation ATPase